MKKFIINTKYFPRTKEFFEESFADWMRNHMYGDTELYGCYAPTAKWSLTYDKGHYWFETNDKFLHRNMWQFRIYPTCYSNFETQILEEAE